MEFPHIGDIIPLLRSSSVKYKAPATTKLIASAILSIEAKSKFEEQFLKRGRTTILVPVELKDREGVVTMVGEFGWFVQKV